MKAIVVTGGAGFIGTHLCAELMERYFPEFTIIAVDDLSGSRLANVSSLMEKGLIFEKIDLRDQKKVAHFFEAYDFEELYCLYLASAAHEGRSFYTPNENMSRNDQAYRIFLTEAIKNNLKKIVVFSSMSRYGDGDGGKYKPPFSEQVPTNPIDPYAVSKVCMEQLTQCQSKVFGFDYTILVPHNVFGEKQMYWDPYRNVLGIWMNLILQKNQPVIYGDGEQTRAFSYIGNCKKGMVDALFKKKTSGEVINIGGIKEYSLNEAFGVFQKVTNQKISPKYLPDRVQEAKHSYCSFKKSIDFLGYEEKVSFSEGLENMWRFTKKKGPKAFAFLDSLEIWNEETPAPWIKKKF